MSLKRCYWSIVPVVILALLAAGTATAREEVRKFDLSPGQLLSFDLDEGGSAIIEGWDKPLVEITWFDDYGDVEDHVIEVHEVSDGLEIESSWAKRRRRDSHSLRLEVKAPHRVDVEFDSGGGGLTLIDLEGTFKGSTAGGGLTLRNVKGEARLRSGGGRIEVVDSELDGKITTGGGEVLVQNVVGDVEARSGGGDIQYKNVRDRDGRVRAPGHALPDRDYSTEAILIASAGGGIDLDEAPNGASVQTGGGDIEIDNADKFVWATTGGGDIEIETNQGPVEAHTGAGDIEVTIERDDGDESEVILMTGLGDISLTVPDGFSMELDLRIGYTRNSSRKYRIISDFEFEEERSEDWDYEHGSPRKFIFGAGRIGDGRHRIEIRTTNGNIRVEKGR